MTLTANSLLNTYCLVIHIKYLILLTEKLNEKHGDRMRFYLSKADTAGQENDRQVLSGPRLFSSCIAIQCINHYPVHTGLLPLLKANVLYYKSGFGIIIMSHPVLQ